MKLKALRAHYHDGDVVAVGAVYEAQDKLARMLIQTGKAVAAPEDAPKGKPAKAKPMTAAASPELVAGAVETEKESKP